LLYRSLINACSSKCTSNGLICSSTALHRRSSS
jgi:hypothetical protein